MGQVFTYSGGQKYCTSETLATVRRAKLGQIQGGGLQRAIQDSTKGGGGGCSIFLLFTQETIEVLGGMDRDIMLGIMLFLSQILK